jgi:hypothetical protein
MAGSSDSHLLVAAFASRDQAERAVEELQRLGFRDDQVGMARRECEAELADAVDERSATRAEEGMATGALVGGALGAAVALLIPGFGPVVAWGILTIALEGILLGAAAGGLIGGLTGLGLSEDDAHFCEREFRNGRPIVVIRPAGRAAEARRVLRDYGGYDRRGPL